MPPPRARSFLDVSMEEALEMPDFLRAECNLHVEHVRVDGDADGVDGASCGWDSSYSTPSASLRSPGHVHVYVPLRAPSSPRLVFRHRASGEVEAREVPLRHAAAWVGAALERITIDGSGADGRGEHMALACRMERMPGDLSASGP